MDDPTYRGVIPDCDLQEEDCLEDNCQLAIKRAPEENGQ